MTNKTVGRQPNEALCSGEHAVDLRELLKHVALEEIPTSEDLFSGQELEEHLNALGEPPLSLIAAGDIMLGGRAKRVIAEHGADYPFEPVLPLLRRPDIVLRNLEAPFPPQPRRDPP